MEPAGQAWQGANGAEALPPVEYVPTGHAAQVEPPVPAAHASVTAVNWVCHGEGITLAFT